MILMLKTLCEATRFVEIPDKTPPPEWRVPIMKKAPKADPAQLPDPNESPFRVRVFDRQLSPDSIHGVPITVYLERAEP